MADTSFLSWPFFEERHRDFARRLGQWAASALATPHAPDVDAAARALVRRYGRDGWLRHVVPAAYGGTDDRLDTRTLCLARDTLARHDGLAEFAFAMQGLGSGPITLFGSDALRARYLPRVARGEAVAAFAISERDAGSDIAAMRTTARRDGSQWVIDGEKTWISNGGIADFYVVFARWPEEGERRYCALVIDADTPGLRVAERLEVVAPHPMARLTFDGCRVSADALVGEPGRGLHVALGTLDVFRPTVGAAALGFARRALDESVAYTRTRHVFGQPLADLQLTRARIADMATAIDAAALLVYRAAWTRDHGALRTTREAAMAKLFATEAAQNVIDDAVQLLGGRGVLSGSPTERLYREVRSLRIYEGTSEIQRLVIAGQVLDDVAHQEHAPPAHADGNGSQHEGSDHD